MTARWILPTLVVAIGLLACSSSHAQSSSVWQLVANTNVDSYYETRKAGRNIVAAADARHYVLMDRALDQRLWVSRDSGASWRLVRSDAIPLLHWDLAHPTPSRIYVAADSAVAGGPGRQGMVFRSLDGGETWTTMPLPPGRTAHSIAMADSMTGVVLHADESGPLLLKTLDGWTSVVEIALPPSVEFVSFLSMPSRDVIIVDGVHRTTDGGATWTSAVTPPPVGLMHIRFLNPLLGWGAGGIRTGVGDLMRDLIVRTTDGGMSWQVTLDREQYLAVGLTDIGFADSLRGFAIGRSKKILATTDGGITWRRESAPFELDNNSNLCFLGIGDSGSAVIVGTSFLMRFAGRYRLAAPRFTDGNRTDLADTATVTWTRVEGAESYHLQASTEPSFGQLAYDLYDLSDTSRLLSFDYGGVKTNLRVRSIGRSDTSEWSGVVYVATRRSASALSAPRYLFPSFDQTGLPTTLRVVWTSVPGATHYRLQLAEWPIVAGVTILVDEPAIGDTSYVLTDLKLGTTYFLRLQSKSATSQSAWTSELFGHLRFTTAGTSAAPAPSDLRGPTLTLSPNPATDLLVARIAGRPRAAHLIDMLGRVVDTPISIDSDVDDNARVTVDLQSVRPGGYFLRVTLADGTHCFGFIAVR